MQAMHVHMTLRGRYRCVCVCAGSAAGGGGSDAGELPLRCCETALWYHLAVQYALSILMAPKACLGP